MGGAFSKATHRHSRGNIVINKLLDIKLGKINCPLDYTS